VDTQVLIVGAGPVGLTLANDLGRRGVRCVLIERNEAPLGYPKMERCNPRTMEIFRRLGLADRVRAAGYPPDWPMDNYFVFSMARPPLIKFPFLTVAQAKAKTAATNDGTLPREPYQIISQYTLEPLLKAAAEQLASVTVRYGVEFESFQQDGAGVVSEARTLSGERLTIRSDYLVGCDGGASAVRKNLGFQLEGETLHTMWQALFRCEELWDRVAVPRGRHYHRLDQWLLLIVQDSTRHFTIQAIAGDDDDEADVPRLFEKIVGVPVSYETQHVNRWTQRLMLSTGYSQERVFLAGDSCHLVIPTGGLGYNTGVGDAIDIAWKLAATLQGWGGPKLLQSYEIERRQVGARNVRASGRGNAGRTEWRRHYTPLIEQDTPDGQAARQRFIEIAAVEGAKSAGVIGAELGYRYENSPVIVQEAGEGPAFDVEHYRPTTWPGARLPHVWMSPDVSVNDVIPDGYTLLRVGKDRADAAPLSGAFAEVGAPFHVLDVPVGALREVYGFDYILVRPDLHVVWRGNRLPQDCAALARRVTGH